MRKTIELKQQEESLNITDNKNYSKDLEFINVANTPFTICKKDKEYFGLIGEHRITEMYDKLEVLEKEIQAITWDRLIQVIWAVSEKFAKNSDNINKIVKNEQ